MRHIRNKCPQCGGAYDFTGEESGRESSCPHCGAGIRLRYKKSVGEHLWEWALRGLMIGGFLLAIWYNQLLTVITAVGFGLLLLGLPLAFIKQTRAAFGQACFWWGLVSAYCLVFASFQTASLLWGGSRWPSFFWCKNAVRNSPPFAMKQVKAVRVNKPEIGGKRRRH